MYMQRRDHPPLADPPTSEYQYRFCLDALLATIYEMQAATDYLLDGDERRFVQRRIDNAQARADELAGRLFDKLLWSIS